MRAEEAKNLSDSASLPTLAIDSIVSKRETARVVGVSLSTLDRMIRRKEFPRPLQLSVRRVGWPSSSIRAWISERSTRTA